MFSTFRNDLGCWTLFLVTGVLLILGVLADRHFNGHYIQEYRQDVMQQISQAGLRIERSVTSDVEKVYGLVSWIATHPEMKREDFETAVSPLFGRGSNLRNIGVAPDMVIRYVYPMQGNEKAIGLDYREVPDQFREAEQARTSGELIMAGPLNLVQGGRGLIGRIPVFSENAGHQVFLGACIRSD